MTYGLTSERIRREEEGRGVGGYQLPAYLASGLQNGGNCLKWLGSLQLWFSPPNYHRRESGYKICTRGILVLERRA